RSQRRHVPRHGVLLRAALERALSNSVPSSPRSGPAERIVRERPQVSFAKSPFAPAKGGLSRSDSLRSRATRRLDGSAFLLSSQRKPLARSRRMRALWPWRRPVVAFVGPLSADLVDRPRKRDLGHFQPDRFDAFLANLRGVDAELLVPRV